MDKVELRELRLYRLAKQAVPWKTDKKGEPPCGELEFLSKSVVEGDTWGTFMSFSKAWAKDSGRTKKLEKHLPRIDKAGEDELDYETQVDDEDVKDPIALMRRIDQKLTKIVLTLTRGAEDQETEREDRLGKLMTREPLRNIGQKIGQALQVVVWIGVIWVVVPLVVVSLLPRIFALLQWIFGR